MGALQIRAVFSQLAGNIETKTEKLCDLRMDSGQGLRNCHDNVAKSSAEVDFTRIA